MLSPMPVTPPRDLEKDLIAHRQTELHGSRLGPVIHDIVYGAHDGIVTTFAVVAGTVGAALPHSVIIILGVANLLADGMSMGAGAFLSLRSERDQFDRLRKEELEEIEQDAELERYEVRNFYEKRGFKGKDLDRVVDVLTSDKEIWVETMMREEHGLTEESTMHPLFHGIATFLGFVAFGSVPLLPYFFGLGVNSFSIAIGSTFIALILVGLTRSIVTRERMLRGILEIVGVGTLTTIVAYTVGVLLKGIAGTVM